MFFKKKRASHKGDARAWLRQKPRGGKFPSTWKNISKYLEKYFQVLRNLAGGGCGFARGYLQTGRMYRPV